MTDNMDDRETVASEQSTMRRKKIARTSRCWQSFQEMPVGADGKVFAKCMKCGAELKCDSASGTKNLLRHHDICSGVGISPHSATRSSSFSHERFCELLIEAIVKHDLPFNFVEYEGIRAVLDYVSPTLRLPCRNTVKRHVGKLYEVEKKKVQEMLGKVRGRICLTSDLWSSQTTDGYLTLTAHFIDSEWKLQKKILSFCHMPPPHNGTTLAGKISSLIGEWGIDSNLFSITLDNASANDSFVDKLRTQLNSRELLLLDGSFFHVRCAAHILNLIVQDGLKAIDDSVVKVRDSVKYIKGSMVRNHKFLECVAQVGMNDRKALKQDVPTRWNSTYLMLESAIFYRRALSYFALCDHDFKTCPTFEEWDKIEKISKFLKKFYDVTELFSGNKYSTSNLFFPKVFLIEHSIKEAREHGDEFMRRIGEQMHTKFQKYWSDYSLILGIAVVLDPRYNKDFVDWAYGKLYGSHSLELEKFTETLHSLFDTYAERWSSQTDSRSHVIESCSYSQEEDALFENFDASYRNQSSSSTMTELNRYMHEEKLERSMNLDVLDWWQTKEFQYPILSHMAVDVLAIPVSTVASESAFSIAGRVLDQYRSSLLPENVQALICTRDWLFGRKDQDSSIVEELTTDVLASVIRQEPESD